MLSGSAPNRSAQRPQENKAVDGYGLVPVRSYIQTKRRELPARAYADADSARPNADADARPVIVIAAVIIAAAFDVAFARGIAVRILDDHATPALLPAASVFIADHAN